MSADPWPTAARESYFQILLARLKGADTVEMLDTVADHMERVLGIGEWEVKTFPPGAIDAEPFTTMSGERLPARCPFRGCTALLPSLTDVRRHLDWHAEMDRAGAAIAMPPEGWTPPAAVREGSDG